MFYTAAEDSEDPYHPSLFNESRQIVFAEGFRHRIRYDKIEYKKAERFTRGFGEICARR
jgi:hypothetical protein